VGCMRWSHDRGVPCARLLTWRPAFAECDFVVLACESPFPPVLPPVFPRIRISVTAPLPGRAMVSGAYLYHRPYLLTISGVTIVWMVRVGMRDRVSRVSSRV
jgi:hypothetical protein